MTLAEVVETLSEADWRSWVYVPAEGDLTTKTPCLVLGDDVDFGAADVPVAAKRLGYGAFLSIHDLLGVRDNLRQQMATPSTDDLVAAAVHYFRNDAYTVVRGAGGQV